MNCEMNEDVIRKIAKLDPVVVPLRRTEPICFFCKAEKPQMVIQLDNFEDVEWHKDDCSWIWCREWLARVRNVRYVEEYCNDLWHTRVVEIRIDQESGDEE